MSREVPDSARTKTRPRYWDKRVSAAYLRIQGYTQEEVGASVGRHKDTIGRWEKEDSWLLARLEARERWYADVEDASRRAVKNAVEAGNAGLALTLLERLDERLAPAKQRLEHSGEIEGGGVNIYLPHNDRDDLPEAVRARLGNGARGDGGS